MDTTDPFLRRNLSRLEARFRARYYSSVQKDVKRKKKGKPSHKTTLKSIEDNRKRLEEVIVIRTALFHKSSEKSPDRFVLKSEKEAKVLKSVKVVV